MKNKFLVAFFAALIIFSACNKDEENNDISPTQEAVTKANVDLHFDHKWGNSSTSADFSLNNTFVHPSTQESITFTTLNYYISNIQLRKSDGTWWSEAESYHLVILTNENAEPKITIKDVPVADYSEIRYTIGVDSTRNVSGAQVGALDPANNMFWTWNTGYIFVKAEGNSPASESGSFSYHIGGFRNANNTNRIRTNTQNFNGDVLSLGQNSNVGNSYGNKTIHFSVNVARLWHGGILIAEQNSLHGGGNIANTFADNFAGAFVIDHLH